MTTDIRTLLTEHGYSFTKPRRAVFEELKKIHEPVTVVELGGRIQGVDKVSVYRTIEVFEKIGVVHRVWTGFKSKVELSESFSAHHHHFTCLKCGKTVELKSEKLEGELKELEKMYGFVISQHSVELGGYCTACRR